MTLPDEPGHKVRRPPWLRGAWTPEEVALVLHARRGALCRELERSSTGRGIPANMIGEIVDDAACAVVMKPRAIRDEEHLRRAFWLSVKLLVARYREGRHRVRIGSRERADFESVSRSALDTSLSVSDTVELNDRLARAADFMAQLDELEATVTAHMAVRGVGIKLTARELGLPLSTVKSAAHSAQGKLEQVAAIAAAGRMCGYREAAIAAHASEAANPDEARAARAHIAACTRCRRSYVKLVREMSGREFRRRASAAFLPAPALVAAHSGLLGRLSGFVGTHIPGSGIPTTTGPRERLVALFGSGAGAAKAAGVLAGATLAVVGATRIHELDSSTHRHEQHSRTNRLAPRVSRRLSSASDRLARRTEPRDVRSETSTVRKSQDGGFGYLGGNPSRARDTASVASAKPGRATSLSYLGGNRSSQTATTTPLATASSTSPAPHDQAQGGEFSP